MTGSFNIFTAFHANGPAVAEPGRSISIMKTLQFILIMSVCIGFLGCSKPGKDEARSREDLDSLVDETWIDLNSWKPIPLKQWLAESEANQVDFLTREEAARIAERSLKDHGVELLAVTGDDTPHWAQFVIGRVKELKDEPAYTRVLLDSSASRTLEVEYGVEWVVLTERLDDDGGSVSK
jgi:hypothetical protein